MSATFRQTPPTEVVSKVLRRAEVAKIARKLQDRLALASYKAQHGQESLSFNDVEARLEQTVKRKRPGSSIETSSNSSSSSSDHQIFSSGLASSPLTGPMFSDDIRSSGHSKTSRKRNIYQSTAIDLAMKPQKRMRSLSMAPPQFETSRSSWKSSHDLPESSPVYHRRDSYHHFSSSHGPSLSFTSKVSTVPGSPPFGHVSEEEDADLPTRSHRTSSSAYRSSPPRTPPPTRSRAARQRKGNAAGEEGADLLLYLATSPSPANPGAKSSRVFAPSTPPSKNQALPSSMMSTPGMGDFNTPGQQFNFADFVNVTPSPAQGAFLGSRTPGLPKTPLAAIEARRRLNFDSLVPPGGSPNLSNIGRGSINKENGLGMELGGELVS
ncbi:hypothetical protein HO173_001058 [Letharia columbiana]|uniref:Uncharacterized protein n=1 Tax=Letharia columbiana TaxID=112416 RepID=A0A8H6L9X7_9LECA|nr:uncharacterized protein HO173_001058 [Letharia columbiana]KAF6241263.1 hypothetical protein HO173_001058 [Letharia columbiana]